MLFDRMACRLSRRAAAFFAGALFGLYLPGPPGRVMAADWQPVTPEELALKEVPGHRGEHAILLLREEDTDDTHSHSIHHYRIKILSEQGRKYGDIEIPYIKGLKIDDIHARTIRPDGSTVDFSGDIHDKIVIKSRGFRIAVKSFTLPEVQVGSVIEFRYRMSGWAGAPDWEIQHELFTRHATFSFRPSSDLRGTSVRSRQHNLNDNFLPKREAGGVYRLELENIPPAVKEDLMPPAAISAPRIEFSYENLLGWSTFTALLARRTDEFAGKPKKLESAAATIAPPSEPPEERLRKLYARVQQIRNLSFEHLRTEKERKQEQWKENHRAEDVLSRGYGTGEDINLLFLALARAAGFEASEVRVATRDRRLFEPEVVDPGQLTGRLVQVRAGGKTYYLDPATRFCPFGLLPWEESAAGGIRGVDAANSQVVTTPQPEPSDAVTERKGVLDLDADGTLHGQIEIYFRGQEALQRRLSARELDDAARDETIGAEIRKWFPAGATVKIEKTAGWDSSSEPLTVQIEVQIPDFAASTGRRLLMPAAVVQTYRAGLFEQPARVHPVYFPFPFQEKDSFEVRVPEGYSVESMPGTQRIEPGYAVYDMSFTKQPGHSLAINRSLSLNGYYFKPQFYGNLRLFFGSMRKADEQQLVLQR
jgi:hypothetical protein